MNDEVLKQKYQNKWDSFKKEALRLEFRGGGTINDNRIKNLRSSLLLSKSETISAMISAARNIDFLNYNRGRAFKGKSYEEVMIELLCGNKLLFINKLGAFVATVYNNLSRFFNNILININAAEGGEIREVISDILFEIKQAGLAVGVKVELLAALERVHVADLNSNNSLAIRDFKGGKDPEETVAGKDIEVAVKSINNKLSKVMEKLEELDGFLQNAGG